MVGNYPYNQGLEKWDMISIVPLSVKNDFNKCTTPECPHIQMSLFLLKESLYFHPDNVTLD